jgi:hypothetical protein
MSIIIINKKRMRKILLIEIIFSLMTVVSYTQNELFISNIWKLNYWIKKDSNNLRIDADYKYLISFQDSIFIFTKSINECYARYNFRGLDTIIIKNTPLGGCTKVCCDMGNSKRLNYIDTFKYIITDDSLYLSSRRSFYAFVKYSSNNIQNIKTEEFASISPNPTNSDISIKIPYQVNLLNLKIRIMDSKGAYIWQSKIKQHNFIIKLKDIMNLKGAYLIQIISDDNLILDNKIVIFN